ncbi:complex I NDUFA9 subunit family protein [Pseudooceanicola sp. CBS1P-1]|uniref:NAD-dependent epimerase/dehydratase family protein n=1 Tax=Pseudooceanicola albus TaxID=2692189 RepID=A0A6L7FZE2_9RHOB|nr:MULTISPECIES: complex I NDUFA9 subunit family protein [Pseudooceanicola]MBT9383907.1 complex I NDUFA9 subunit family protein [Pseudooceanicola endophyticus]MXN16680.1 NAD-dependent epimerase/dehydratase family protein [Pseudooceanicola albus]
MSLSSPSKLVTIFGGSGFVGRYIARRMAKQGWRVRVAVRRPNEAGFVRTYGVVGQVEPVFCNIRDDASVRAVTQGASAVVNCVGTFATGGKNNVEAVQTLGAGRIARIAAEEGITAMVHLSALGADAEGPSRYARSKAEGEAAVLAAQPGAMILRPSVIFGPEDKFYNRFAEMARNGFCLPIVSGGTKFQPVYVDDVACAAELYLTGQAEGGLYELGGPDAHTFRELMQEMLEVIQRRRPIIGLPRFVAAIMASALDGIDSLTAGTFANTTLTRDQLRQLGTDSVVSGREKGFADLGFQPLSVESVLPDYLWRFRPDGQYAALRASARNLHM